MAPVTHLVTSWLIATKTTDNPRDCRLVALAGILPDLDGLGMIADIALGAAGKQTHLYHDFHHLLWHGLFAAVVTSAALACFAQRRWRVFWLALAIFHLHLFCDLIGSRGPEPTDLWPIYYLGPFSRTPMLIWHDQWPLDGWNNRIFALIVFCGMIWVALREGRSVIGVFSQRADATFVRVLRGWRGKLRSPG